MCRMARGQATCQKTHAVEIDTSVLPQYLDTKTNKMRLTTDSYTLQRDQRWIPTLKPTVSLPKSSNRRDIDLPEAARGCRPLHVDKRVIQVDLLRPKLDTVPPIPTLCNETSAGFPLSSQRCHCRNRAIAETLICLRQLGDVDLYTWTNV